MANYYYVQTIREGSSKIEVEKSFKADKKGYLFNDQPDAAKLLDILKKTFPKNKYRLAVRIESDIFGPWF